MSSLNEVSRCLHDFSSEIESCLNASDWQGLSRVLAARQVYLETILHTHGNTEYDASLRGVVERVLEQDKTSQAAIQEQQARLLELNSLFEQGRQAVKAYNSGR